MTTVPPPVPNGAPPSSAAARTSAATAPLPPTEPPLAANGAPLRTALATPAEPLRTPSAANRPTYTPSALPSPRALALVRSTRRALELAFQRGVTPDADALVGWEFRGINWTPPGAAPLAQLAGIKKFVKGMFRAEDGRVMGYNCPVVQNVLDGRWRTRPSDTAPKRFGFYEVAPVDATARDNHYLHALLLDYGKGGNAAWDATRGLRDYLVQVDESNPDLLLGKAYYALGPARVAVGCFVLERFRRGPADLPVQHRT